MKKDNIDRATMAKAIEDLKSELARRFKQKGTSVFTSYHEILGIIEEEKHELVGAVIKNDIESIRSELMDIAVGCIFGAACIDHWEKTKYKDYTR